MVKEKAYHIHRPLTLVVCQPRMDSLKGCLLTHKGKCFRNNKENSMFYPHQKTSKMVFQRVRIYFSH